MKNKKDLISLKQENETLQARLNESQETNIKLNKDAQEYKENIENLKRYDLGNINGLSQVKLNELENKMNQNLNIIKQRKEELLEQDRMKSLCIICYENKKNTVILDCGHLDICQRCANNLRKKKCPRCQMTFQKTLKVNHFNS